MRQATTGVERVQVLGFISCVLGLVLASCAGGPAGDGAVAMLDGGAAVDASFDVSRGPSASPALQVVASAQKLAAELPGLAEKLDASREGWEPAAELLSSRGYRSGGVSAVGARLPARAERAFRVGLGQSDAHTVSLTPEGARGAEVEQVDGRAVYRDAYRSTDLLFVASETRVEWMYLLRDDDAPSQFDYTLELPSRLPTAKVEPSGQLAFMDERGEVRLRMTVPVAADANGVRREGKLALHDGRLVVSLDTKGLTYPVLLDPAIEVAVWQQRTPSSAPDARVHAAAVYDVAQSKLVLFGGEGAKIDGSFYRHDTWEWDGSKWTDVTPAAPAVSPPGRGYHAMAYDSQRRKVVLFGGYGDSGYGGYWMLGDTWEWDGATKTWTNLPPTPGMSASWRHAMAYDVKRGKVVLFGGQDGVSGPRIADTWEWDGSSWTKLTPAMSPSARMGHAMTYDSRRERVLLYGGLADVFQHDTWEFDGTTWQEVTPTLANPWATTDTGLAYDGTRGKAVLFSAGTTWEWDGSSWAEKATTGPGYHAKHAMAFDSARRRMVLFGGDNKPGDTGQMLNDTWEYHVRGNACSSDGECDTGHCVDGVCCETASCAACERCDSAASPGVCAAVKGAEDPDSCTAPSICGPTGVCGLGNGQVCTLGGSVCASGNCVDGFCCDAACSGACDACNGAQLGWPGAVNGTCKTAPAEYAGAPACSPFRCDGAKATCTNPCTKDSDCIAGHYCNAAGSCEEQKEKGAACNQEANRDCKVAGCRSCATGFCVDGYCCENGCDGACKTCAETLGTCTTVTNADDVPQCTGANTCSASGACTKKNGEACSGAGECASGNCVDGYCCNSACDGGCDVCNATKGTCTVIALGSPGASPSCSPYLCGGGASCPASCAKDGDCASGSYCAANGECVERKKQGSVCESAAGQDCKQGDCRVCATGSCVDGFCCDTACDGACNRCDGRALDWSGATNGTCTTAPAGYPGSDVDDSPCGAYACTGTTTTCTGSTCSSDLYCGPGHYCDKSGHCASRKAQGDACNASAGADCKDGGCRVCTTGNCVDGYCCDGACSGACDVCNVTRGTCTNVAKGSPGAPSCAPNLCPGDGASCGGSCDTDSDCAASAWCRSSEHTCQSDQANGEACTASSQCQSANCVDGVCCDTACEGTCVACTATLKESGTQTGVCGPAKAGVDPHGSCEEDPSLPCGPDGVCDGKGACRVHVQGTTCGATICSGNLVTGDVCDGLGACKTVNGQACAPYVCRAGGCTAPCASDSDCAAGNFCDEGTCKTKLAAGVACTVGSTCASGFCVEGVCCNTACNGVCQACKGATKVSGADGVCGAAKVGLDPHDDCPDEGASTCQRDGMCDGAGACRYYAKDVECKPRDCGGGNVPTTYACNGVGACLTMATADCKPNVCADGICAKTCATESDCVDGAWCDAGLCKPKSKNGEACTARESCASNICADGVCCNTACSGQCEACAEAGSAGTCTPVTGQPRGGRPACASGGAEDACAEAKCDGTTRDECVGFVGSSVACRAASCSAGVATLSAKCDGKGGCPDEQTKKCEPYVCAGDACGTSCDDDGDCAAKFRCDTSKHDCVAREATTCSAVDDHTQSNPDGTTTACAPYRCVGDSCKTDCNSIDECTAPNICDATGHCTQPDPVAETTDEGGGCGCRVAGEHGQGRAGLVLAALFGLALVRRRRGGGDVRR